MYRQRTAFVPPRRRASRSEKPRGFAPNGNINDVGGNDIILLLLLRFIDQNKEAMQM